MSQTPIDFDKIRELLNIGDSIRLYKNQLGLYTAEITDVYVTTNDSTPEQALTRLAFKVLEGQDL
jgi:hypothetical protein